MDKVNNFLVGNVLREVRNVRLNCNNAANETQKSNTENGTYVKKIRKGNQTFPYASAQWQKKNIKNFAESQGFRLSPVTALSTTEAVSEGNPAVNYDEDVMGFMIAKSDKISVEAFNALDEEGKKGWVKDGKNGYKKNVTVKRRSNLMMSTLQAIGNTRITDEFSSRQTDKTPILYSKEVYASDMSAAFILDKANVGVFQASGNEAAYRDYTITDIESLNLTATEEGVINLSKDEKVARVQATLKGIQFMPTRVTQANNLEDLSAKFMIFADYSIGNSVFNNIFEDNKLKVDYLKEAIEENETYRVSKIYIGCRSEYFKQGDQYLRQLLEETFGEDDRFVIGDVGTVVDTYLATLA